LTPSVHTGKVTFFCKVKPKGAHFTKTRALKLEPIVGPNLNQSEPAATNAPVGHSVHWMGCTFSFGANGVHSSPFLFAIDIYT